MNGKSQLVVDHLELIFSKIVQYLCQEVSGPITSVVDKLFSLCQKNSFGLNDSMQSLILSLNFIQSTLDSSLSIFPAIELRVIAMGNSSTKIFGVGSKA